MPLAGARLVLDAGSGTGALLGDLRKAAPAATAIAVDRAEGMLRAGAARIAPTAVMDLQALALASGAFDAALLAFVLFHLPDPLAGLRETRRVLRPGGAIGLTTWGDDPGTPGLPLWRAALDDAGAPSDPRDPRVGQHALMDTPDKVAGLLQEAGFADSRVWRVSLEHAFSADALLALHTTCGSPVRRLDRLAPGPRGAVIARVTAEIARLPPEALVYRAEVLCAVARA